TNDFSAALAQSLAATPADATAATNTSAAQSEASDADSSSPPAPKQSATDPAPNALALFEQALAGALNVMPSPPPVAGAPAAPASGTSSSSDSTIAAGQSSAAALSTLLTQSLTSGSGTDASNRVPAAGTSTPAAPSATATAAAAAFTAATQMPTASHIGSQPGAIDSSNMTLASQVGTSAWTDELGTKVTWMAQQGIQSASLQLSPEHLGPLQVNISVHDGQASVWFGAAQPDTRAALQQSLPQLRQLFANQGLTLTDAGVSREPPRGQDRQSSARPASSTAGIAAVDLEGSGGHTATTGGSGLLDTYA
ncbi:MAG: flagellar hook-length control protein FliK, partial [Steroidobacteraceae bacterium]